MVDYCYHTHTYRCGHAQGTEEEYVLSAIENGYKVLGFTDHVFIKGLGQNYARGDIQQLDDYIQTIKNLKEKYKDKIEIYLGFECEYSPFFVDYYKSLLNEKGFDYLILGQHDHFTSPTEGSYILHGGEPDVLLKQYVDDVIEGMRTGLFTYVAHPDLFIRLYQKVTPFVKECFAKICEGSVKYDIPLELNLGGVRWPEGTRPGYIDYPCEELYKIAKKYNCKVIVGIDAHNPKNFEHDKSGEEVALNIIKKLDLNHITRIKFKKK